LLDTIVKSKKARYTMATYFAYGLMESALNDSIGDDDDNDALNEFDKEKGMTLINPFSNKKGDYIKVPMSPGLNVFKYFGNLTHDYFNDKKGISEVMGTVIKKATSEISPLDGSTPLQFLAPTIMDPFVQLGENRAYHGGQLAPTSFLGDNELKKDKYFKNASLASVWTADIMNDMSGGDNLQKGFFDYSPNQYDVLLKWVGGGTGQFLANGMLMASDMMGADISEEEYKIPIVSSFARKGKVHQIKLGKFYDVVNTSRVKKYSDQELSDFAQNMMDLVESGNLDYKKAQQKVRKVYRDQSIFKAIEGTGMSFEEGSKLFKR